MKLEEILKLKKIKKTRLAEALLISKQNLSYKIKAWDNNRRGFTINEMKKIERFIEEPSFFFEN